LQGKGEKCTPSLIRKEKLKGKTDAKAKKRGDVKERGTQQKKKNRRIPPQSIQNVQKGPPKRKTLKGTSCHIEKQRARERTSRVSSMRRREA